jgi:hypothetical protein
LPSFTRTVTRWSALSPLRSPPRSFVEPSVVNDTSLPSSLVIVSLPDSTDFTRPTTSVLSFSFTLSGRPGLPGPPGWRSANAAGGPSGLSAAAATAMPPTVSPAAATMAPAHADFFDMWLRVRAHSERELKASRPKSG